MTEHSHGNDTIAVSLHFSHYHKPRNGQCFLACSGINFTKISTGTPFNSGTRAARTSARTNKLTEQS